MAYTYAYSKHFDVDETTGKTTVSIPNTYGTSMFTVIVPDGWTE